MATKITETTLEIDLNALAYNYRYLRAKAGHNIRFMAVVKANAYGSGSLSIAQKLEQLGTDYLAVAYLSEAIVLREGGIRTPIVVLHPQQGHLAALVRCGAEPNLYSPSLLKAFLKFAEDANLHNYPVHLKINTGMNRVGFRADELQAAAKILANTKFLRVASIFSHLAASEDLVNRSFAERQIATFDELSSEFIDQLGYSPLRHVLNTSGILNFPEAAFDMVRSGIGLYGFGNAPEHNRQLRPIGALRTVISQLHHLKEGEFIGYNFGFTARKETVTATLPLGHADGIARAFGHGKGFVYVHGQRAPIIGNVCMDMLMIDVTTIACREGDVVTLFDQTHTAEALAAAIGTIPYELITGIAQRVKRNFVK